MMSQVTNRAPSITRLENTSWNMIFNEAKLIISERGALTLDHGQPPNVRVERARRLAINLESKDVFRHAFQLVVKTGNSQRPTLLVISCLSVANLDDKLKSISDICNGAPSQGHDLTDTKLPRPDNRARHLDRFTSEKETPLIEL